MAEFLSPGIFIEEVNVSGQQVDAVGTSTMATVGWSRRGAVDTASLVTSNDEFVRQFGEYTNDSRVPISVQAFFGNGGTRMYMVRVVPTDAVSGDSTITSAIVGEALGLGDGTSPQTIGATMANLPLHEGTVIVRWHNDPAGGITGENPTFAPAEGEALAGPHLATLASFPLTDAVVTLNWTEAFQANDVFTFNSIPLDTETITFDGRTYTFLDTLLNVTDGEIKIGVDAEASMDNLVAAMDLTGVAGTDYSTTATAHATSSAVKATASTMLAFFRVGGATGNGKVVSETIVDAASVWTTGAPGAYIGGVAAAAKTATITGPSTVGGTDAARITAATIDRDTGDLSITFVARTIGTNNGPGADTLTVDYEPGGVEQTVTDDGAGIFSATTVGSTVVTGTVDYVTGAVSVTWTGGTDTPFLGNDVVVNYSWRQWNLAADNQGAWSDRLKLRVAGNDNFFTSGPQSVTGAGTYSKFDLTVLLTSTLTGEDEVKETYEEIVFDDAADALYFPDVLNGNSDFVQVTDLSVLDVPAALKGVNRSAEVLGTGDATPTLTFVGTLDNPGIVKTSMVITYQHVGYSSGAFRTLTADVNGLLSGTGLDTTKTNSVDNTTGVFTLNFLGGADAPADTIDITAAYITVPDASSVDYVFANGADGTLTGATFDRTQFSSPILQSGRRGMYALDRIDEVMQLVIPDWAGDTTVMGDQIDYAELRLDIFNIFTTPQNFDASEAKDFKTITYTRKTKFAAMYWPWIKVTDPTNAAKTLTIPPLAWVAGIYARTDSTKNVGKAPGGTIDGALRFLTGLERDPDKGERDTVYPVRINPLINTTQTGLAVWGVRTMSPTNDVLRYVNAVRLFQFVEKSIFNSTFSFVFENITSNLYSDIKTTIDGFLLNLFNTGHFAGSTPSQAFFVIVDSSNNPPEVVNLGQVIVDIGIAPNRPGEFIRFRFSQKTLTA